MQPLERMTDKMRESERNPYYRKRKRELNHQLYERVQSELAVFHKEMLGKTPEEIYEAAHEIAAKHGSHFGMAAHHREHHVRLPLVRE